MIILSFLLLILSGLYGQEIDSFSQGNLLKVIQERENLTLKQARIESFCQPTFYHLALKSNQGNLKTVSDTIRMIPDKWFALDKVYHLLVSFSLVGSSYHLFANRIGLKESFSTAGSIGGVFTLGITKEFYDAARPEDRFSYRDLIYDIIGIGIGYFVFIH